MTQPSTEPHWKTAFSDFDGMDFEVPEGFEDNSWRHDTCPSFVNEALGLVLYANYKDPALREVPGAPRFSLFERDADAAEDEITDLSELAHSEDFADILAAIEQHRAERQPKLG